MNLNKTLKEIHVSPSCHIIKISWDSILNTNFCTLVLGHSCKKIIWFVICVISSKSFLISVHGHPLISAMDTEVQSDHGLSSFGVSSNSPFYFQSWMRI